MWSESTVSRRHLRPKIRSGSSGPSSTRSSSGVSSTATTTGSGTSPGSSPSSTTSSGWGSTASGCCPFYPSPLRDGGYDISDFYSVHPESGTVDDLRRLLDEAHARGIRVIADLVMNHTSDQHPWFIESRQSTDNPKADWYVWNDDDHRWPEARVVFVDVERSNWSYDPQRNQYYWHRFYSHQPDLNYDNPEVAEAMLDVVRFWLDLGLDGFRLDAVPFLFQRDGTAGENLPETHAFIRRIRGRAGRRTTRAGSCWPRPTAGRPTWPSTSGTTTSATSASISRSCPGCSWPSAASRAIRSPKSWPTPRSPRAAAQWAIFLRNHDELTLEMVSEEERDYLFAEYAKDPRMKRHMGIGRRLAPLLDRDRRLSEFLYYLLFTLPGSPVLYYGDEIQMGDNLYLGDRDSVRTPMQWTPDRNGGFSRADFAQLYLPPLMDPVYGFTAVNVEAQQRNPSSFLHWMRRILAVRREFPGPWDRAISTWCRRPTLRCWPSCGRHRPGLTGDRSIRCCACTT